MARGISMCNRYEVGQVLIACGFTTASLRETVPPGT